jgi:hypothetical protein
MSAPVLCCSGPVLTGIALLGTTQILVKSVQQPSEEGNRITLLRHGILSLAPLRHFLQKLVGTRLGLEEPGVPYSFGERTKPLDELGRPCRLLKLRRSRIQQERPERRNMQDEMDDYVQVVVRSNVVQTDVAWVIGLTGERVRRLRRQQR